MIENMNFTHLDLYSKIGDRIFDENAFNLIEKAFGTNSVKNNLHTILDFDIIYDVKKLFRTEKCFANELFDGNIENCVNYFDYIKNGPVNHNCFIGGFFEGQLAQVIYGAYLSGKIEYKFPISYRRVLPKLNLHQSAQIDKNHFLKSRNIVDDALVRRACLNCYTNSQVIELRELINKLERNRNLPDDAQVFGFSLFDLRVLLDKQISQISL